MFNMKPEIKIQVPDHVNRISDWINFDNVLPQGKSIVNKVLCGCGMTHYYLSNNRPVIWAAPRKHLISNKYNDTLLPNMHYYDCESIVNDEERKNLLIKYLSDFITKPFKTPFPPKILVTFDSFHQVVKILYELGCLPLFTIVVDEFTCIFTDATYKGLTEMRFLKTLDNLQNKCVYISATPIKEEYLNLMEEFNDVAYFTIEWPENKRRKVKVLRHKMNQPWEAICSIIEQYKKNGYFQYHPENPGIVSREAVFFINSITDIVKVIEKMGLTPSDTRIIWANTEKNEKALKKINKDKSKSQKFKNDMFPDRHSYKTENKPITFVTRAAFEGVDLYSDTATLYIFADPNKNNLGLDISVDLPQIIGRCRTETNPFRNIIHYYCKQTDKEFNRDIECRRLEEKKAITYEIVDVCNNGNRPWLVRKLQNAQENERYCEDYVDIYEDEYGNKTFTFNKLVFLSELRALEIKANQYKDDYTFYMYMYVNGYECQPLTNNSGLNNQADFIARFSSIPVFEDRLKWCFDTLTSNPSLTDFVKNCPIIQSEYQRYIFELGHDFCKSKAFKEIELKRELDFRDNFYNITTELKNILQPNETYTKEYIVSTLQSIYDKFGLSRKAKAIDLKSFFSSTKEISYRNEKNAPRKGLRIELSNP